MSFVSLSKEQKQYLLLGAIVTVALIILVVFGVKVSLSSISEAKLELQGLSEKIEKGEKFLVQSQQAEPEFRSTIAELRAHLTNLPPDRNYYSWATEVIYAEARMVRFEIDAIDEAGIASVEDVSKDPDQVELESYALRITAHGGYENVKQFLRRLARNHPLVRVTGIEISTGSTPDIHDVQLFIEWPFNLDYIMESWSNMPPERPEVVDLSLKKTPTPLAPRTESDPKSDQTVPTVLANPRIPVAEGRTGETGEPHDSSN